VTEKPSPRRGGANGNSLALAEAARRTQEYVTDLDDGPATTRLLEALDFVDVFASVAATRGRGKAVALVELVEREQINRIVGWLEFFRRTDFSEDIVIDLANRIIEWVDDQVRFLRHSLPSEILDVVGSELAQLASVLKISHAVTRIEGAEADLRESRDDAISAAHEAAESAFNAQELVGGAATSALGAEFFSYATAESKLSFRWSAVTVGALVIAAAIPILVAHNVRLTSVSEEISRLAVAIPVAAIALYASRVAGHHRMTSRWAHTRAVQLYTIRAYSEILDVTGMQALRLEFGRTVFSPPTSSPPDEVATPGLIDVPGSLEGAASIVKEVANTTKAVRS
jgi:hypothetical protein